jgi:hypothetical protein
MGPEWRQTLLEFVLGAAVFFFIIVVAHFVRLLIGSLDDTDDIALHITVHYGEIVLLVADCLIGLMFVARGLKNAWKALVTT